MVQVLAAVSSYVRICHRCFYLNSCLLDITTCHWSHGDMHRTGREYLGCPGQVSTGGNVTQVDKCSSTLSSFQKYHSWKSCCVSHDSRPKDVLSPWNTRTRGRLAQEAQPHLPELVSVLTRLPSLLHCVTQPPSCLPSLGQSMERSKTKPGSGLSKKGSKGGSQAQHHTPVIPALRKYSRGKSRR